VLTNHRRAFWFSLGLLAALVFMLVAVGRHPTSAAPTTTIPFVGSFDETMYLFRVLNVAGGGLVTIPLRVLVSVYLLIRRRFLAFSAWVLTWAASELLLTYLKDFFHRGRPPGSLVGIGGYSFPSGHAVAGAAVAVALVLVWFPPGPRRRKWEWAAMGFAFVMAFSRVYLYAHWFSDVVAGVLLGAGVAIGSAALVTEVAYMLANRGVIKRPATVPGDPLDPTLR
jgi:membrane-associated phospholipid phosphatase